MHNSPALRNDSIETMNRPLLEAGGLALSLARSQDDIEALQRLRYRIFTDELQAVFPDAVDGRDIDRFDPWCQHFMVRESQSGRVVGTYRVLTPENALQVGGYYSESEFDISALDHLRAQLVEVGRSCIDSDFRHGGAIMLLWAGVARIVEQGGYRYMLGCASVSLRDGGAAAAEVWRVAQGLLERDALAGAPRITPLHRYPVERLNSTLPARVPPLIKGYLKIGATICGEPAWDPDFNTADFPILMDLERLDKRYRRHFGLRQA